VIPYLGSAGLQVPNEEDMFLQRLRSSTLWASVLSQVERNRALQQEFDAMKARSRSLSSSIFRHSLRGSLWLSLAIEAELLPVHMLGLTDEQKWSTLQVDQHYEFLQSPWEFRNGVRIVKGTNCRFEPDALGGPFTNYTALFDTREHFDGLRESFLIRACGQTAMHYRS
jgi:hypothetical protein